MPSFQSLFEQSGGQPVVYNGQTIQMVDDLPIVDGQSLSVKFESTDSDWRQGIRIDIDGFFEVNGQKIDKAILLWHDTAPNKVLLKAHTQEGRCMVRNLWDVGDGTVHSWHNGAAMIVEGIPNGRRYRCNDGRADDDFNDIIFTIERVS